jgi:hypothetical protein
MPLKPADFSLMKAWAVLREARKNNNGLSAAIYNRFAEANAMPRVDDVKCDTLKSYNDFVKYHNSIWLSVD